jgi:LysM domain
MPGMTFTDHKRNITRQIPMLPEKFSIKQPRGYQATPILGGYPHIQITAQGERTWNSQLDLSGLEGEAFYYEFIIPSYGFDDGQPNPVTVAWGGSSRDTFKGFAVEQKETEHDLGKLGNGLVFAYSFNYELVTVQNRKPRVLNLATATAANVNTSEVYVVKQGDDLGKIAKLYGISVAALSAANTPRPAFVPKVGTKFTIPGVKK